MNSNVSSQSRKHHRLLIWDILMDKRTRSVGLWVAFILIGGAIFYHYVEGWSWVDSIYFCFISLATVGYGDLAPTTPGSKIFTIFYIANGLGVLLAFVDIYSSLRVGRPVGGAEKLIE